MSRLHAHYSLGGVVGAAIGALLSGRLPVTLYAVGMALLLALGGAWAGRFLLPDPPAQAQHQEKGSLSAAVWLLGALCFLGMLAEGANYDWAALYFRDVLGSSASFAGAGYLAFVAAMTLGHWYGDRLRAALGDEQSVRGGALVCALGLGLALLMPHPISALFGFALSGIGLSNVVPVMYGTAGHALAGRGIAAVASIGYGGLLLGPPLIGFIAQHAGLTRALGAAALCALAIFLLGGVAFRLIKRQANAKVPAPAPPSPPAG